MKRVRQQVFLPNKKQKTDTATLRIEIDRIHLVIYNLSTELNRLKDIVNGMKIRNDNYYNSYIN